jgi:hypothetical protein
VFFGKVDESDLIDVTDELMREVKGHLVALGHPPEGDDLRALGLALADWAGVENLEERIIPAPRIDPVVLKILREKAAAAGGSSS